MHKGQFALLLMLNLALWGFFFFRFASESPGREVGSTDKPMHTEVVNSEEPDLGADGDHLAANAVPLETDSGELAASSTDTTPSARILGRVVGESGQPIEGAEVRVRLESEARQHYLMATDDKGRVDIALPVYRTVKVSVTASGYADTSERMAWPQTEFEVRLNALPGLLAEDGSREISGIVADEDGRPIADVRIYCTRCLDMEKPNTDAEGRYRLTKVFEGAEVVFRHKAYEPESLYPFQGPETDVVLHRKPVLVGRVMNRQTGKPVESFKPRLVRENGPYGAFETKGRHFPDGIFRIEGIPRDEDLVLRLSMGKKEYYEFRYRFRAGDTGEVQDFWIDASLGRIQILLLDQDGKPASGCAVSLKTLRGSRGHTSDKHGFVTFYNLRVSQRYDIQTSGGGYVSKNLVGVVPEPIDSDADPIVLRLNRGTKVEGSIDPEQYVQAIRLTIVDALGNVIRVRDFDPERYAHDGLPLGHTRFVLQGRDYEETIEVDIVDPEYQKVDLGDVRSFAVTGSIFRNGEAVGNRRIYLYEPSGDSRSVVGDEQGNFSFQEVKLGTYYLGLDHSKASAYLSAGYDMPGFTRIQVEDRDLLDLEIHVDEWHFVSGCFESASLVKITGTMTNGVAFSELVKAFQNQFFFSNVPSGDYEIYFSTEARPEVFELGYGGLQLRPSKREYQLCEEP
ncbi:Carboxypeptidase regulatory-like domain-containing protein [Sulfidibacter corallicola]|uniref:Carboxypeptidase regulatory-like domain-containing protein n=1 Tax=Sulfidibacter corallicola TaxID=2818388 RepID=A0A8A4TFW3_SULCO|nr:carboxypeptidase-like regulatory domain-containing protein [Sulfidibacter corallicola]QTD48959.1 carboxypeptidase regulatory-like domain-containing protein [Sulfidibacter corallicola]